MNDYDESLKQFDSLVKSLPKQAKKICSDITALGLKEAQKGFNKAVYDEGKVIPIVEVKKTSIKNGYAIEAIGEDSLFIEFGAGVYYNGKEPYPERPSSVSPIGTLGKGRGKRKAWGFKTPEGTLITTHGTPAQMPMYKARKAMMRKIEERFDD